MATRARIEPERVTTPRPPTPAGAYQRYFGVEVRRGKAHAVTFSASSATRPFLTANEEMWEFFEPELRKRLSALDAAASIADRVRAVLLELLPTGATSVDAVARKLNVSRRTLQRRLSDEGSNFQAMLNQTRKELARHYLKNSSMSAAEISFLLGFEDPNSFFRAFHDWTGDTPERVRTMLVADS